MGCGELQFFNTRQCNSSYQHAMGISSWKFPSLWASLRDDQGGDVTRLAQENQLVATLTKVGINISSRAQSGIHRATSSFRYRCLR